jgi:hypothetical protein
MEIAKALQELERLEKLQQQKLDRQAFEIAELKKLVRKQILDNDPESEKKGGGLNPWK